MSTAELFDKVTGIHPQSTAHTTRSDVDDILTIVKDVQVNKILTAIDNREHKSFPGFAPNPLKALNRTNLEEWIKKNHNNLQPDEYGDACCETAEDETTM